MTISQENLALMIADELGEDKESVLIGLAADRVKTPQEQAIWANIAKKYDGLGLSSISMTSGALASVFYTPKEALAMFIPF
ncbi:regulator [Vibrio sp. 404]|uniref:Regulator n=1 Tax=Vibrio marinisediminis TaxID=2758441 RepID=A0A7W2FRH2_9VIBR|nr:DUF3693 domain-containing protein [Vibrio marinisediminis]MBA5762898.1 regulator [Vibrio marinisediminis]